MWNVAGEKKPRETRILLIPVEENAHVFSVWVLLSYFLIQTKLTLPLFLSSRTQ